MKTNFESTDEWSDLEADLLIQWMITRAPGFHAECCQKWLSEKKKIKKSRWVDYACTELSYAWLASSRELNKLKRVIS